MFLNPSVLSKLLLQSKQTVLRARLCVLRMIKDVVDRGCEGARVFRFDEQRAGIVNDVGYPADAGSYHRRTCRQCFQQHDG